MAEFQIKRSSNAEYYFRLCATGNNKIILSSELYKAKNGCENGINAVKTNADDDSRYERLYSANGQYYFNLKARNGEVIGTSELYVSAANRDEGIELVKKQAPVASVADLS